MSTFLSKFMHAARHITQAERCLAFDNDLNVQERFNFEDADWQRQNLGDMITLWVEQAITNQQAVISNNLITDPSKAPETNTHLKDLRMIVTIPIEGSGAIYLDQPVAKGVFSRDVVDKITEIAIKLHQDGQTDITEDDLTAMFEEMS